ncbi:helix-turn-helix domain-containing protein [Parapedobacter indicus]|uniref:Helix-turn-helix n=1 Tax=Parapedobacter indicus TaxID=1477437 RepID=A0A1I3TF11_9SPHI|nr:helix-turn-helix transcriptional regulator [Parapedobacter indicus]PPK99511.1 helix-turn-helix protein [Parapedobacter indicus]SFJ69525.1 Helix-turn-helix [Parapedobacter indicus]
MVTKKVLAKKVRFGKRLQEFRRAADLTQRDFADFMNTKSNYISELENGLSNPSLEMLIRYANFYGIEFYELANPNFPIPSFDQLPSATRKAIHTLKNRQQKAKEKVEVQKKTNKQEGVPGRAKQLHTLLEAGFFKKPKTGKDAFLKLYPGISKKQLTDHTAEIGKITVTLGQGKFLKLLDKLDPAPGTTTVRFVEKAVDQTGYADLHVNGNVAAEKSKEKPHP